MQLSYRPIALGLFVLAFSAAVAAGGNHYFAPVNDPVVKEECGGCHLAYAPSMLPASSWKRLMGNLNNHFGDDASLDAAAVAGISRYLVANAADTGGRQYGAKLMRGVELNNAPLRITELPKWVREHREVPAREWQHKEVRSKPNCIACHTEANRGYYED